MSASSPDHNGIGWWSRERTLSLALFLLILLGIALCYLMARPFLSALAWSLALAIVGWPVHKWIRDRVRWRNLAAGVAVVLVAITVVGPTFFVIQQIAREAATGVDQIKDKLTVEGWRSMTAGNPRLARLMHWIETQVDLRDAINAIATWISTQAVTVVGGSVRTTIEMLVVFFFLFYFFRDQQETLGALRGLLPLSSQETDMVFGLVSDTIKGTIYGTVVVALVQGVLGGLIFWWLGLPAPILWGIVMAVLALVPILGAFIVWMPAAIVLALQGHWIKAIILTLWGALVIGLIDNVIYPVLVGKRLRFHTVPVFIALIGGLFLFGAAGLILGPLVLAVTIALVEVWRQRTLGGSTVETGFGPPLTEAEALTARVHKTGKGHSKG